MSKFYSQGMHVIASVKDAEVTVFSAGSNKRANEVAGMLNTLFLEAENTNDEHKLCSALEHALDRSSVLGATTKRDQQHLAASMLPHVVSYLQRNR